jgi:hypothetical protein
LEPSGGMKARPSEKDLEKGGRKRIHGNGEDMERG